MRRRMARLAAVALAALPILCGCAAETARPAPAPPAAEDQAPLQELKQGRDLLQAQQPEAALEHLDRALALYQALYAGETRHLYCARSRDESILYSANAAAVQDPAGVRVLPSYWADAHFLEALALNRLGRGDEAEARLRKAQALSPANAQYLAQLGDLLQARQDWAQSLALYRRAESASEFSPEPLKQHDLARALRGQARVLAAQGRYDESEQLYRRCLQLDPGDARARGGLDEIRLQRAGGGA